MKQNPLQFTAFPLLAAMLISRPVHAAWQLNMLPGVTPVSREIYHLHMLMLYICAAIAVAVFSVMFYAIVKHRKSKGAKAANFHDNLTIEILWTIIPTLILVFMAVPAVKVLMHMSDSGKADINIKVTGYQWKWRYDYMDDGFGYFSNSSTPAEQTQNLKPKGKWYLLEVDKPLVLPIHKKVRFLLTANDVIHSWWVPELGVKMDAMPGAIHEAWARIDKPGVYRGQCTELCGMRHGYMPIVVVAKTPADYQAWVKAQQHSKDPGAMSEAARKAMDNPPPVVLPKKS